MRYLNISCTFIAICSIWYVICPYALPVGLVSIRWPTVHFTSYTLNLCAFISPFRHFSFVQLTISTNIAVINQLKHFSCQFCGFKQLFYVAKQIVVKKRLSPSDVYLPLPNKQTISGIPCRNIISIEFLKNVFLFEF